MNITVRDFQSLGDTAVEARGLTVIVGPSDRGKSALLRAIEAALFNRPGDQFVRQGAKTARVALQLSGHAVVWEKGGGVNKFQIDGADFSRVGKGAPPVLQELGFRDVVVGAREKEGKLEGGETLRPQFAEQFNPEFVLDHSGPFIAELLVRVSRLGVVQRAGRLCAADLKARKALQKTRSVDLAAAEARVALLVPLEPLRERVLALAIKYAALTKQRQQLALVKALLAERAVLVRRAKTRLKAKSSRGALDVAVQDCERLQRLRILTSLRTQLKGLPKLRGVRKISKVVAASQALFVALRPLLIERRQNLIWIAQAEGELARAQADTTRLAQWLAQIKVEARVCPACERPF